MLHPLPRTRFETPPSPNQAPKQPMPVPMVFEPAPLVRTRWEYHIVVIDAREEDPLGQEQATALGADGWLLAAVVSDAAGGRGGRLHYYFVRPTE
jgi:hypothetical protein